MKLLNFIRKIEVGSCPQQIYWLSGSKRVVNGWRSVLLTILCLLLPLLLFSQWLETTIYVPDSLFGVSWPQAFTYNATNNKIYVGGGNGNCVIAIDGETDEKIVKIPAGSDIWALVWNATNNKVYCANSGSNNVTVIDGIADSVITTIHVGDYPWALVWNAINNKVYCANVRRKEKK